jgi:hypothetical protein
MPSEGTVFDGFTSIVAQDADTHPSYLPEFYVAESVNRTFRGGINRTRPSIRNIKLIAAEGEEDSIVNDIQTGNFQGSFAYRGTTTDTSDGILVSVSGVIYFINIANGFGYCYKLIDGNDPGLMHTFFVQAEDRVYIQNGYQNAITWGGKLTPTLAPSIIVGQLYEITSVGTTNFTLIGAPSNTIGTTFIATAAGTGTGEAIELSKRLNPFQNKMPVGTVMEYAFGRVFVSDKYNQIYASDIIFGNNFTDTTNTENFTEITYWAEGGAFTTPANMGEITAMKVMPMLSGNLRGQGELVILTTNGAFSMDVSIPRAQWNTSNIQRISLLGRGCVSPYVTTVNSELWYRSQDGWAFYSNSQSEFYRYFSMRKLSREVNKWVLNDTPWMRQFANTIYFDNYLISTVAPETKRTDSEGLNRYHRGMIVLDLDQSASPAPDAQLTFRWNGLWTGIRPLQLIAGPFDGIQRAFAFSFDEDNKNRLYEITSKHGDDYGENGTVPVQSFFTTRRFDFSNMGSNKFLRKKLTGGDIWLSEIRGEVTSSVQYRSDSNPCWSELKVPTTYGCDPCSPVTENCTPRRGGRLYKRYKFNTPSPQLCNNLAGIPSIEGSEFQIKVELVGPATVDRVRIMANVKDIPDSPVGDCPEDQQECPEICCQERYWDYHIQNG